jgi:RHS repeat-associated protein
MFQWKELVRRISFLLAIFVAGSASAAGNIQWSATLTNQDTNTIYSSTTYPTLAQAVAAMKALDPADTSGGQALLVQQSISAITPAEVTYNFGGPTVSSTTQSAIFGWESDAVAGSPVFPYVSFPTEAAAAAAAVSGACPASPGTETLWLPTGSWTLLDAWVFYGQPSVNYESRQYSRDAEYAPGCTPVSYPASWSPNNMYQYQPVVCPTGLEFRTGESTPPPWPCTDKFIGEVTGAILDCPGNGSPTTDVGDPCDVATGDFSQMEQDYSSPVLKFARYYHSVTLESFHGLGVGWTHNFAASMIFQQGVPVGLSRPDGHHDALAQAAVGVYISVSGDGIHVQQNNSVWTAYLKNGTEETYSNTGQLQSIISPSGLTTTLGYNAQGQLLSVSDAFGHSLQFSYNSNNQVSKLIEPDGSLIQYGYDSHNNLITATYPDSTVRTYQYTNSTLPNNLTGILDEQTQQFLSVTYEASTAYVSSSYQGGSALSAQNVSISYPTTTSSVATDALGATHTYGFTNNSGYAPRANSLVISGQTQSFNVAPPSSDQQQRVTQYTDANNNVTTYAYDPNHLTSMTEAYGTSIARTTTYSTYQDTLTSLPTLIIKPRQQLSFSYYPSTYQLKTKTVTDTTVSPNVSRTWTYTYSSVGQLLTVVGPRTDLVQKTTYTYYSCTTGTQCGEVETITNPAGQVTTYGTYNGHGQPLTITDPNGVVTTLTYDKRQRILSREVGTETTSYSYWPAGLLKLVTLPDSSTVEYTYDAAHRLDKITDGLGNYVSYTLDAMGNRTGEKSYDPSGTLHRSHTSVYNALNELYQDINAADTAAVTTTYGYDPNHNQASIDAPLARNTGQQYDALNRISQVTDPNSGVTKIGYDADNNVASMIDPRTFTTSYTHDGFDEATKLVSPDTGTSSKTYDSGGNVKTATDARSAIATYSYDAMNRETQVVYSDETINYTYDAGTYGKGRLTGASDANHTMAWTYNAQGRITGKSQTVASVTKSVGYGYTNDDLTSIVSPSGQTIVYAYTNHQITSITINGTTLLSAATYDPFGPPTGWAWGNNSTVSRTYTEDGNPNVITTAGVTNTYTVDNASRITEIADSGLSSNTFTFGYDLLDRVKTGTSSALNHGYTYDSNGNRSTETGTVAISATISSTNNQIDSTSGALTRTYSYDSAGNTKSYTGATFTFNDRGRMSSTTVSGGTTNYIYNALGQLIEKSGYEGTTILVYDEAGHLLGEYSSTGALIQETVWMGDLPVATLRPNGSSVTVYYVHADQSGTPRKITNPSGNTVEWRWDPDTFGTAAPSVTTVSYNIRFPGQYYLQESALYYNYFRTYDPQTGRYVESDPIGLRAGTNTYAYVRANPISHTDRFGLDDTICMFNKSMCNPNPPPPPPPPEVPSDLEAYLCKLINTCNGDWNCVFRNANQTRLGGSPPNPISWNDPLLRDAENFAAAAAPGAFDYGPYSPMAHDPGAIWAYQYVVKPYVYPALGSRTTQVSGAAYQAGLAGSYWYSIPNSSEASLKWCDSCSN